MAEQRLTNEQWAVVLGLLSEMVESDEPERILEIQKDETIRAALETLWSQHQQAEKIGFLEDQLTVVGELSAAGTDVFQPAQLLADRFAVLRMLGRGGMGEVYLADDQRLIETVALKTIKRELARDKENRARFLAEVQNSRRVTHPNVCRIFDLFEHDGVPFFSMEYVAGPTLAEVLATGPLNPERARTIAIQTAEGLLAAHNNGILHCDFKPNNVILAGSGKLERAVITDFGLARAFGGRLESAGEGSGSSLAGTPPYMAPELLRSEPATVRSDIYAFGKVLQALLPGNKLGPHCAAADAKDRPESLEVALKELRGTNTTRRDWILGLAALAASATGLLVYTRTRPWIVLGSRQRVQVNGFTPESPEASETAKAVRNLLMMALRQSSLLSVLGDRSYPAPDRPEILEAGFALPVDYLLSKAREQKAALAIDGRLLSTGSGLRLGITVYDTSGSVAPYTKETAVPDRRALVRLAELAADDLRENAFSETGKHDSYRPLEEVTSRSLEAVDYYFRAVAYYQKRRHRAALTLLGQALDLDPGFTLAYHYRALVLSASGLLESAQESAEKAYASRDGVTTRERNWIEGQYHNITLSFDLAAIAMEKNAIRFDDEAVFHRQLAHARMRQGLYRDAIGSSKEAFKLDPFSESNAAELLTNLAEAGQTDEFATEAAKMGASGKAPDHYALWLVCLQQREYRRAGEEARKFGDDNPEVDSLSRLCSVAPLVMSGRFFDAIQTIENDLAQDSTLPAEERGQGRIYNGIHMLGQLYRLKDEPGKAAKQADFLVQLPPLACNLIRLREGIGLAFDLGEVALAEKGLDRLRSIAKRWPTSHSASAVWLTEAMLKDAQGESGANQLFGKALATWPDPVNLFYAARWQGKVGNTEDQLRNLEKLEALRGKVFKHHFAGMVVLGWLEQAKCLRKLARFKECLRMYEQVAEHWKHPQADGPLVREALSERADLQRRLK